MLLVLFSFLSKEVMNSAGLFCNTEKGRQVFTKKKIQRMVIQATQYAFSFK
ncbi:MAG: hypothetical protein BSOLF_0449 [Candidatus Carbobacillus altaicus]|uniref:Uncharacterized protein n=1 Tax=Candidatus Carbonibacillus altaicus TaxID=2163959 RepID=A0A2R6Y5K3_9BACL|nr:MAG: hypothetical protein BSOLF_0449 [Candidatus Carbobacillus altaicus]